MTIIEVKGKKYKLGRTVPGEPGLVPFYKQYYMMDTILKYKDKTYIADLIPDLSFEEVQDSLLSAPPEPTPNI